MDRLSFLLTLIAVTGLACDLGTRTPRTSSALVGVDVRTATLDAGQVLVDEGFALEELDPELGKVTTTWREQPRLQLRYKVLVGPSLDATNRLVPDTITVTVLAWSRLRELGGWGPEDATRLGAAAIAARIEQAVARRPITVSAPPVTINVAPPVAPPPAPPPPADELAPPPSAAGALGADTQADANPLREVPR